MAETSQFNLPLLSGGQAQKSVTVNEALSILDAVAQLRVVSSTISVPPVNGQDGDAYLVPIGASGDWFAQDGTLAISANGGWRFVTPKVGWQAYNIETGTSQLFDGTSWLPSTLAATSSGTATEYEIVEVDFAITPGSALVTPPVIPAHAQVVGVTGRVIQQITGPFETWSLGVDTQPNPSPDRYATGLGKAFNSYVLGMSNAPTTYYKSTSLLLSTDGGDFVDGEVRLAVHYMTLVPPRAV